MNRKRKDKILIRFALASVIMIILYLAINLFQAFFYDKEYSIDFQEDNFQNENSVLSINEKIDSGKFISFGAAGEEQYAEIAQSPLSFIFRPEEFPLNKKITLSAYLQNPGNWDMSIFCPECPKENQYNWQPFFREKLKDNYSLIAKYGEKYIYSKDTKDYATAKNLEDWILKNVNRGASLEIMGEAYPKNRLLSSYVGYEENSKTKIEKTLRGPQDFYVYLSRELAMEIEKSDLNWYDGSDEVKIELRDMDGNIIFDNEIISDDGTTNISKKESEIITKKINKKIDKSGIYQLNISEGGKAKSDWVIKKITINTNKIIFSEKNNLILDEADLYTETFEPKEVGIYVWHKNAKQDILINSSEQKNEEKLSISDAELGQWIYTKLEKGSHRIKTKGDQKIKGTNFSLSPENYFEPFIYDLTESRSPHFILTDFYYSKEGNWSKISKSLNNDDMEKVNNLKILEIQITNKNLNKNYQEKKNILENNFKSLAAFNEYEIFGKKDLNKKNTTSPNINAWLKTNIPANSKIKIGDDISIDPEELKPEINISEEIVGAEFVITKKIMTEFIKMVILEIE